MFNEVIQKTYLGRIILLALHGIQNGQYGVVSLEELYLILLKQNFGSFWKNFIHQYSFWQI